MRIVYITAGAAGMYCGSCLNDNALATELIARRHDVLLVPLYTPTRTDEPNVSQQRVFFGGISVYLEQKLALFRHTPRLLDRLWDSAPMLRLAARRSIPTAPEFLGDLTVSMLRGPEGRQEKELGKLLGWLTAEARPDVICLTNSLLVGLAGRLKSELGAPVCCTLQGEDLFLDGLSEHHRRTAIDLIRSGLEGVDAILSVSEYYRQFMASYLGVPAARIEAVPLGITLGDHRRRADVGLRVADPPFRVGYLARIAPEKGLHQLADAYRRLRRQARLPRARLAAAGYLAPEHRGYLQQVEQAFAEDGMADEFEYVGEPDRAQKIRFLESLSVLSVPTVYVESKGRSVLEAMASGVPVVQPAHGSFVEMIERTGGGLLVEPGKPEALADGIDVLWSSPELAADLGQRGFEGVRRHHGIGLMADRVLDVFGRVTAAVAPARGDAPVGRG